MSLSQWFAFLAGLGIGFGLLVVVEVIEDLRVRRWLRRLRE